MKTEDILRLRELAEKAKENFDDHTFNRSSRLTHRQIIPVALYTSSLSPSVLIPLLDELIEARKVVEFYSDRSNWGCDYRNDEQVADVIHIGDVSGFINPGEEMCGGRRARAHQAKFNGGENGK
jgi:hypothetical protein